MNAADLAALLTADPYGMRDLPPMPPQTPLVPCERCAGQTMERNAAFSRESVKLENGETISVPTKERAMRWQLRPIDGPCERCGNDKPQGTYPIIPERGSVTRFGEHGGQVQYLVTEHQRGICRSFTADEYAARKRTPTKRLEAA
jgi:hypothetical protein